MREKGIFTFSLVLLFTFTLLAALDFNTAQLEKLGTAKSHALEMEEASFIRTNLELIIDDYIAYGIKESHRELLLENKGACISEKLQKRFITKFTDFLKKLEMQYDSGKKVKFYFEDLNNGIATYYIDCGNRGTTYAVVFNYDSPTKLRGGIIVNDYTLDYEMPRGYSRIIIGAVI